MHIVELLNNQHPQVLLGRAARNPSSPKSVLVLGIAPTQVQDLALGLVEPHEVRMSPLLQPAKVPLDGILSLWMASCPSGESAAPLSLVSSANLLRVHLGDKEPNSASLTQCC